MKRFINKAIRKCLNHYGFDIVRIEFGEKFYEIKGAKVNLSANKLRKANYGCGINFLVNWLNIDVKDKMKVPISYKGSKAKYVKVDLAKKHPFPDNYFEFGFAEDFLEHLNQAEGIIFLSECYRTLQDNGVLRLSFPCLEGALKRYYVSEDGGVPYLHKYEAYTLWEHKHFFSIEEFKVLGGHIGFKKIELKEYGKSGYPELCDLDTRERQKDLNIYVELTK